MPASHPAAQAHRWFYGRPAREKNSAGRSEPGGSSNGLADRIQIAPGLPTVAVFFGRPGMRERLPPIYIAWLSRWYGVARENILEASSLHWLLSEDRQALG